MAIQYIGQATGINSAVLPAHQAGDLIVAFAFRDGSTTPPSIPGGNWKNIRSDGANACSGRIGYCVATSNNTTSGTWTNATSVVFLVYRDTNTSSPIGNTNSATASSVTVNYPALSVSQDSIVVGFAGHVSANVNLVAPTGMTNRAYVADATDEAAGHDTNGAVSSWGSRNTSVGGTAAGWRSYVVEVKSAISANVSIEGVETTSAAGEWLQTSNDWYAWAFDRSFILLSSANANTNLLDIELSSNAQEVQAFVSIDASTTINGIGLNSQAEFVATNADGNGFCSHIVATTYIHELSSTGDAYSTTNSTQISTEFGSISAYADAVIVYETTQLDSQSADIFANGDATSSLITIEMTSESEAFTLTGDANGLVDGTELSSEYENIAPIGTANVQIEGLLAETAQESVESTGDGNSSAIFDVVASFIETVQTQASAESQIDSIELISAFGEVSAFADQPISAEVSINGISLQVSSANVVATAASDEVIQLSGNPKRYAANEFKYAKVTIAGISTKISTGAVKAIGSISISARANVQSVGIKSEVPTIYAEGVKWITEDELMTLLAA